MTDTITITKEEIIEAREDDKKYICKYFLYYKSNNLGCVTKQSLSSICRLCKKITEFVEEKPEVSEDIDWLDGEDYGVK